MRVDKAVFENSKLVLERAAEEDRFYIYNYDPDGQLAYVDRDSLVEELQQMINVMVDGR